MHRTQLTCIAKYWLCDKDREYSGFSTISNSSPKYLSSDGWTWTKPLLSLFFTLITAMRRLDGILETLMNCSKDTVPLSLMSMSLKLP